MQAAKSFAVGRGNDMASNGATYQAVALQDGTSAVMRADPAKPQLFEVVAKFYDIARAQE